MIHFFQLPCLVINIVEVFIIVGAVVVFIVQILILIAVSPVLSARLMKIGNLDVKIPRSVIFIAVFVQLIPFFPVTVLNLFITELLGIIMINGFALIIPSLRPIAFNHLRAKAIAVIVVFYSPVANPFAVLIDIVGSVRLKQTILVVPCLFARLNPFTFHIRIAHGKCHIVVFIISQDVFQIETPSSVGLIVGAVDFFHKVLRIIDVFFFFLAIIVNHVGQPVPVIITIFEGKFHLPFVIEVIYGNPSTVGMRIVIENNFHIVTTVHRNAVQFRGINILVAIHFLYHLEGFFQ